MEWSNRLIENLRDVEWRSCVFKRIIYALCFAWLCYLDYIIGSVGAYLHVGLKFSAGIPIAVVILTSFKLKDFMKMPYFVWAGVFFAGEYFVMQWAKNIGRNPLQIRSYLWTVGLFGVVIIRMLYGFFMEKKKLSINWARYYIWFLMMAGMAAISPKMVWIWLFFIAFGLFYLIDFKKKDVNNLFVGMVEGVILGFVIIQGFALIHRPYDQIRYVGAYYNANLNALFYLFSYSAVLCKWYLLKLKRKHIVWRGLMVALAGIIVGLTFLTMCRTAVITMVLLTGMFLLFQMLSARGWKRKVMEVSVDAAVLLTAIFLCFIPTYNMVRYIPAYANDPVHYDIEADLLEKGKKIEKDDPILSDKYYDFNTVVNDILGRLFWFHDISIEEVVNEKLWKRLVSFTMISEAAQDDYSWVIRDEVYVEPGSDKDHPMMSNEDAALYPAQIRLNIYRYYWNHMKSIGPRGGTAQIWVTDYYVAPHAHNNLLQIAGEFGWIFSALLCILALIMVNTILFGVEEKKSAANYYRLFVMGQFLLVYFGFGMLDVSTTYCQFPFTMFFVVQYLIYHQTEKNGEEHGE